MANNELLTDWAEVQRTKVQRLTVHLSAWFNGFTDVLISQI
jgi:hypothetical protein